MTSTMRRSRAVPIALGVLALFAAGFVITGLDGWGTPAANESPIGEVSRWCERVSDGLMREPVNTLGNLGFVVAGVAMLMTLTRDTDRHRDKLNPFIGPTPVALLYASAAIFLGPGSMLMHGTHTRFGAWMDNVSMVAYILVPWLFNLARMARWSHRTLFATYAVLLGVYAAGYWFVGPDLGIGLDLFGISIAIWSISEVLYRWWSPIMRVASGLVGFGVGAVFGVTPAVITASPGEYWWVVLFWVPGLVASAPPPGRRRYLPWYWLGVASFVSAYAIWLTGTADHPSCNPDSLVQPHAIWHLLSALATWSFFRFLRTETSPDRAGVTSGPRPA
ncbi:MAG: ceramidase domain-containing protein [Acidimicrobiia bacterium]